MNIFFLSYSEKECAAAHCDKHVNKMIIEHLQMMSVAAVHYGYLPAKKKDGNYYSTRAYKNHPCTKWVKESSGNFLWLFAMTYHLCGEFRKRFGKEHAGYASLMSFYYGTEGNTINGTVSKLISENVYPNLGLTQPAQAMPSFCRVYEDPVQAYRNYYNWTKWRFAKWAKVQAPNWWAPGCCLEARGEY